MSFTLPRVVDSVCFSQEEQCLFNCLVLLVRMGKMFSFKPRSFNYGVVDTNPSIIPKGLPKHLP